MSWEPDLGDYLDRKGAGDLLPKALGKVKTKKWKPIHDDLGLVAYELDDYILVAKKRTHGYLVSVAARLVIRAYQTNRDILMYLDEPDAFYVFGPLDITKNREGINKKDGIDMVNFRITLGERYAP